MRAIPRTCPSIRFSRLSSFGLLSCLKALVSVISPYTPGSYLKNTLPGYISGFVMETIVQGHQQHCHHAAPAEPANSRAHSNAAIGVIYTCPMHPQIRQDHRGLCPICGMTLEPL